MHEGQSIPLSVCRIITSHPKLGYERRVSVFHEEAKLGDLTGRNGGVHEPASGHALMLSNKFRSPKPPNSSSRLQALDPHVVAECAKNGLKIQRPHWRQREGNWP